MEELNKNGSRQIWRLCARSSPVIAMIVMMMIYRYINKTNTNSVISLLITKLCTMCIAHCLMLKVGSCHFVDIFVPCSLCLENDVDVHCQVLSNTVFVCLCCVSLSSPSPAFLAHSPTHTFTHTVSSRVESGYSRRCARK